MFSFIANIFNTLIFQPLYNGLIALYNFSGDFGVAIILLTIVIRFLLMPLAKKSIESQKKMQELQPEIKELQEKYKNDHQTKNQKIMELYQKKQINPAAGCLPLLVQIVFLLALYRVFMLGINANGSENLLYGFVKNPGHLKTIAFGFLELAKANIWLGIIAAALQFYQSYMMMQKTKKEKAKKQEQKNDKKQTNNQLMEPDFSELMQKQMLFMGPVLTLMFSFPEGIIPGVKGFPAGLILYWTITTIFMIVQQFWVLKIEEKEIEK